MHALDLFRLDDRLAVVTGGSSGIGRAIAIGLAGAGATVVLVARHEEALAATVAEIDAGDRAGYLTADAGDRASLRRAADQIVAEYGEPDILVNCAGVNPRPPMDELTDEIWDSCLAVNLDGSFQLGRRFGPAMAERGHGRIINIGSQQSFRAFGNSGAYGVAKAAVLGLTRSQSEAWSRHGVCCNAIVPGFVVTPLTGTPSPERLEQLASRTHVGRNGLPEDFIGAALFLASDASSYVTGQAICVDGGFSAA